MEPVVPSVFDEIESQRPVYFAGTGQRFANLMVDTVAVYASIFLVSFLLGILSSIFGIDLITFLVEVSPMAAIWRLLMSYAIYVGYYTLCEGASKGRTLGKLVTRTKVVTEDGEPISWNLAFKRSLCRIIPFETLSGFGGNPWHDSMTKTCVVKINR